MRWIGKGRGEGNYDKRNEQQNERRLVKHDDGGMDK